MFKISTRFRILVIATGVCIALSPFLFNWFGTDGGNESSLANTLRLQAPAFMSSVEAAPLSQTSGFGDDYFSKNAGLAAYTQVELTTRDLELLANSDRIKGTNYNQQDGYVSGTMTALGYESFPQQVIESMDIQIYVDINGWVIAYLQKGQPASMILNWLQFEPLTLEKEVREIIESILSKRINEISFYHFQYDATGLFVAGDAAITENGENSDTFQITIPDNFLVQESSWSHMIDIVTVSNCGIKSGIDFSNLSNTKEKEIATGQIDPRLTSGSYAIDMSKSSSIGSRKGPVYCGVALIYTER